MSFSFTNRGKGADANRRMSSILSSSSASTNQPDDPHMARRIPERVITPVASVAVSEEQSPAATASQELHDKPDATSRMDRDGEAVMGSEIQTITKEATEIFSAGTVEPTTVSVASDANHEAHETDAALLENDQKDAQIAAPSMVSPAGILVENEEGEADPVCDLNERRLAERRKTDEPVEQEAADGEGGADLHVRAEDDTNAEIEERRERDRREQERRDAGQPSQRLLGRVMSCDGNFARLVTQAKSIDAELSDFWSVGKLISIESPGSRIVGMVFKIHSADQNWVEGRDNLMHVEVELVGEITDDGDGEPVFSQGISHYPALGAVAHRIRQGDLAIVHRRRGKPTTEIGSLSQDSSIGAAVSIEDMLSSHFAVVGTTGVGKSSAVSLLLRKVIKERPNLRVLILDPHNEFAAAFPDKAVTIDGDSLELPFWLFQFEEISAVIFRGRTGIEEEADALRDLIPLAKRMYNERSSDRSSIVRKTGSTGKTYTVDTPVPYRMADLFSLIEDEIGKLEGRHSRVVLKSLKNRLELLTNDPRYKFMFAQRTIEDNMDGILADIFRIPSKGRPITAFQLSGIPSEIVDSVISVLCRMAFDLAVLSRGACEVLVMCEEAHRYVPSDRSLGFIPTRQSIARIAKEGRKYGAYLGVVTQRPGELDSTILSQCSTIFAMRLGNEQDQRIIRSAISDSAASTISFLSSIGNREAIAFGNGVATPMRMRFADIPRQELPDTPAHTDVGVDENGSKIIDLRGMIRRMRSNGNGEQNQM